MIENIDISLFYFINVTLSNPFFDKLFVLFTELNSWILLYIWGAGYLLYKHRLNGLLIILMLVLSVVLADQLSATFIKPLVGRMRPCHSLEGINLLVNCGGGKSFPSSHASNNFAVALVLSSFFLRYKTLFFVLASMVAISRVYVGVHYPIDILAGALIGLAVGFLVIQIKRLTPINSFLNKNQSMPN